MPTNICFLPKILAILAIGHVTTVSAGGRQADAEFDAESKKLAADLSFDVSVLELSSRLAIKYYDAVTKDDFNVHELDTIDFDDELLKQVHDKIQKDLKSVKPYDRHFEERYRSAVHQILGILTVIEFIRVNEITTADINLRMAKNKSLKSLFDDETMDLLETATDAMKALSDREEEAELTLYARALDIMEQCGMKEQLIVIAGWQIKLVQMPDNPEHDTRVVLEKEPSLKIFHTFVDRVNRYIDIMHEHLNTFHIRRLLDLRVSEEVNHEIVKTIEELAKNDYGIDLEKEDYISTVHRMAVSFVLRADVDRLKIMYEKCKTKWIHNIQDVIKRSNSCSKRLIDFINDMVYEINNYPVILEIFKIVEKIQMIVTYPADGTGGPLLRLSSKKNRETQKRAGLAYLAYLSSNSLVAGSAASSVSNLSLQSYSTVTEPPKKHKFPLKLFGRKRKDTAQSSDDLPAIASSIKSSGSRMKNMIKRKGTFSSSDSIPTNSSQNQFGQSPPNAISTSPKSQQNNSSNPSTPPEISYPPEEMVPEMSISPPNVNWRKSSVSGRRKEQNIADQFQPPNPPNVVTATNMSQYSNRNQGNRSEPSLPTSPRANRSSSLSTKQLPNELALRARQPTGNEPTRAPATIQLIRAPDDNMLKRQRSIVSTNGNISSKRRSSNAGSAIVKA